MVGTGGDGYSLLGMHVAPMGSSYPNTDGLPTFERISAVIEDNHQGFEREGGFKVLAASDHTEGISGAGEVCACVSACACVHVLWF